MTKRVFIALMLVLLLAGVAEAQKSFYNKDYKFGFKYPAGSTLKTDEDSLFAYEPMKGLGTVTIRKSGAVANIAAAEITQDKCKELSSEDGSPRKKKFGTITFTKTEGVEGGMESVQPYEYYRAFHGGVCYEIRIAVGMAKYSKRSPAPLLAQLYPILRTFYFK